MSRYLELGTFSGGRDRKGKRVKRATLCGRNGNGYNSRAGDKKEAVKS